MEREPLLSRSSGFHSKWMNIYRTLERRISSLVCPTIGTGFQGSSSLFTRSPLRCLWVLLRVHIAASRSQHRASLAFYTSGIKNLAVKTSRTIPIRLDSLVMSGATWISIPAWPYHNPLSDSDLPFTTESTSQLATHARQRVHTRFNDLP